MIIFDFECPKGHIMRNVPIPASQMRKKCYCGLMAKRIFTKSGALNEKPAWINSTKEVIDKDDPLARRLLDEGSRTALEEYKKKKGIRLMDENEPTVTHEDRMKEADRDHERRTKYAVEKHIERNRIDVRG